MAVLYDLICVNPKRIRTLTQLENVLDALDAYEKKRTCEAVVVLKQNIQLGGSYKIVSKEEAIKGIDNPRKCEWYIKFYPRSYFEDLREKFNE